MKTCPYCGRNIKKPNRNQYYCDFCCMALDPRMVKENRERLDVRVQDYVFDSQIEKTTPELLTLSTFELLYLLKMIRKERTDTYHRINTFYRAGQHENTDEFIESFQLEEKVETRYMSCLTYRRRTQ
jgi:hypothetical protein